MRKVSLPATKSLHLFEETKSLCRIGHSCRQSNRRIMTIGLTITRLLCWENPLKDSASFLCPHLGWLLWQHHTDDFNQEGSCNIFTTRVRCKIVVLSTHHCNEMAATFVNCCSSHIIPASAIDDSVEASKQRFIEDRKKIDG